MKSYYQIDLQQPGRAKRKENKMVMVIVKLGHKNDAIVYGHISGDKTIIPLVTETDFNYLSVDIEIYLDSGCYPGITDVNKWACREAQRLI